MHHAEYGGGTHTSATAERLKKFPRKAGFAHTTRAEDAGIQSSLFWNFASDAGWKPWFVWQIHNPILLSKSWVYFERI